MNLSATLANAAVIFETAKRLKAVASRQAAKDAKVDTIHAKLRELRAEANATTTAMVNSEDLRDHRDLAEIARDIKTADTQLDRAIDSGHSDRADAEELAQKLQALLDTEIAPVAESADTADTALEDAA